MQVKYGTYAFPAGIVGMTTNLRTRFNAGNQAISQIKSARLEGYLISQQTTTAALQADIAAQQLALEAAFKLQGRDLVLYQDSGAIALSLPQAGSITGVMVKAGPSYDRYHGPEGVSEKHFVIEAEAEYPFVGTGLLLLDFHETLFFAGGRPRFIMSEAVNADAIREQTSQRSPYVCIQDGSATGYQQYPWALAQVLAFPNNCKGGEGNEDVSIVTPTKKGVGFEGYGLKWHYRFESSTPLSGTPRLWI